MKIAMVQYAVDKDPEKNLEKSLNLLKEAAENDADLIVYPEIQLLPFFPQYSGIDAEKLAIPINHEYVRAFQEACRKNNIYASPNLYINENGKNYNMSLLIDNRGEIIGKQKMVHIGSFPQFYEKEYYTPSEEGFTVTDTPFGKIGIVVCFDRHFPESIREEVVAGADLILIPTANTTDEPSDLFEWEVRIQAFQNEVPIVMVNRTGYEDEMTFCGESLAVDRNGALIFKANNKEGLYIVNINLENSEKKYLPLRRSEIYSH